MDLDWTVHNDQCGSDHFPIFISINKPKPQDTVPKWQLSKANWSEFERLAIELIEKDRFKNVKDPIPHFL